MNEKKRMKRKSIARARRRLARLIVRGARRRSIERAFGKMKTVIASELERRKRLQGEKNNDNE